MKLLKWIVSDRLANVDLSAVSLDYFGTVLTLYFLVEHSFITVKEADIFLLSVKHVIDDSIFDNIEIPSIVNERAFRIPAIFYLFFKSIGSATTQCGLRHLTHYLPFDGVLFHNLYSNFQPFQADPSAQLVDIDHCRVYKNIH
jgi:hypothetical protein